MLLICSEGAGHLIGGSVVKVVGPWAGRDVISGASTLAMPWGSLERG